MTAKSQQQARLEKLLEQWEHTARRRFDDIQFEKTEHGKELLRATAVCYFNCASELRKALDLPRQNVSGETSKLQR